MLRVGGEVGVLLGVFLHVEKFDAFVATFAVLNVGPVMFAEEESFSVYAEGGVSNFVFGIVENGGDVFALQA